MQDLGLPLVNPNPVGYFYTPPQNKRQHRKIPRAIRRTFGIYSISKDKPSMHPADRAKIIKELENRGIRVFPGFLQG